MLIGFVAVTQLRDEVAEQHKADVTINRGILKGLHQFFYFTAHRS